MVSRHRRNPLDTSSSVKVVEIGGAERTSGGMANDAKNALRVGDVAFQLGGMCPARRAVAAGERLVKVSSL